MRTKFVKNIYDRICLDCGLIGMPGFKLRHRCCDYPDFIPMRAMEDLKDCGQCKYRGRTVGQTLHHTMRKHLSIMMVSCPLPECGRGYAHRSLFLHHIKRYHGNEEKFLRVIFAAYGPCTPWDLDAKEQ